MKQVKINSLLETPQDGFTYQREWNISRRGKANGLYLLIALFAGNVGPGIFMISFLSKFITGDYFFEGMLVGFFLVLFGYALPHLVFLGRMDRFWRAMVKPQSSWISRGFIFANVFILFSLYTVAHMLPFIGFDFVQPGSSFYNMAAILAFGSAFLLSAYPGFIFSKITAIPFWNSSALIPLFIIQSFGAGIALTLILVHMPGIADPGFESLLPLEALLITLSALILILFLVGRLNTGKAGKESVNQLLHGVLKKPFLYGAIACEIVIPLVFVVLALLGLDPFILVFAELIQLFGIFFFKYCLLSAGSYNKTFSPELLNLKVRPGMAGK